MTVRFIIPGEPMAKQRPKFTTIAGHARAITPQKTTNYENYVRLQYTQQSGKQFPDGAQLYVLVDTFTAIPQSKSKKMKAQMEAEIVRPTKKPDWDNLGKIICDSLNGIAYHDDSCVVDGRTRKFYSNVARVEVIISDKEISSRKVDARRNHP